ncbi:unnamed protein product [Sphagnum balticum]
MCSSSPLLNMVSMDAQSWAPPRGGRHLQEEEDGGIVKRCVSMEVLSSLWSGGEKSSRSYASTSSLAWPFSFLNLTPLPSSRTSSRGGGASLRAASSKPLSGSISGLVVQEDANSASNLSNSSSAIASEISALERSVQVECEGHDGVSDFGAQLLTDTLTTVRVPLGTVKMSEPHLLDAMVVAGRLHSAPPGAVLLPSTIPVASTSGKVESGFWMERRKAHSHSISQSPGMLFVVDNEKDRFAFIELEQGKKFENNIAIGENHSVSTCIEQGSIGDNKSIWLSTSHKLDVNHMLATQYANDLKGGADFTFNTSHKFVPASRLSTCFHADSVGDPTLEVELEQGREAKKVLESVVANLRTGDCVLRLQSKKLLKHNMALTNSYMTNLRQHSLRLETTTPFKGSGNISSSFITNFQGTQELCVKGLHRIGERNVLTMSYITDLSEGNQVSMEAKHSVKGSMETALKVTNDLHGALQLCVSSSHIRDCNRWGLTYRNCHGEEHSVGLDWRHEVSPEKYFSVQASTQNWRWKLCADLHIPLGMPPKLRTPCL